MKVRTRFAPSPTGLLHIGGARTALFNYLLAKRHQGQFLLRIEDTDRARSTPQAIEAILSGLNWLELQSDEEVVYQSQRQARHQQVALELLAIGAAYRCFATKDEIEQTKAKTIEQGQSFLFRSPWRDVPVTDQPQDKPYVIRLKAPTVGITSFIDKVQGSLVVSNDHLDDLVLLRSDGTPTYMLAVVVDDHDMDITHIIRGDDHIANTFKQLIIYQALSWQVPIMAHIPLIHDTDGSKLSKRHGALDIASYKTMGYLPEALSNYLLRLGWSHGNDEIISRSQAIMWFNLENIVKSPARLDFKKMDNLNKHYLKALDDKKLITLVSAELSKEYQLEIEQLKPLTIVLPSLKLKVRNIEELAVAAKIYLPLDVVYTDDIKLMISAIAPETKIMVRELVNNLSSFTSQYIEQQISQLAAQRNIAVSNIMQPLRLMLTGKLSSSSIFELLSVLGQQEALKRIDNSISFSSE